MYERFRQKLDELFENAPETHRARELKEELLGNLMDKYNDLISNGKTEEDAFNIAISSIGDIDELINGLKEKDVFNQEEIKRRSKKSALILSISIGMYIMSVVIMVMLSEVLGVDENLAACIMLTIDAIATCLIIYNLASRPKYLKTDSTIVEEFKEWKSETSREREIIRSIRAIVWLIIMILYFILGFVFDAWAFSWIIFIVGAAITRIIKLSFQLRK